MALKSNTLIPCLLAVLAIPAAVQAGTATPLRDGWRMQSG